MGETAADTRQEIEDRRNALGSTLGQLRARRSVVMAGLRRSAAMSGAAVAAVGTAVAVAVMVRRRRGGALAARARTLPAPVRSSAVPAARGLERWAAKRRDRAMRQRDDMLDSLSQRIAEQQALAERKANPLWRRTSAKALETAAAVGTAALIRRALSSDRRESDPSPRAEDPAGEISGRRQEKAAATEPGRTGTPAGTAT